MADVERNNGNERQHSLADTKLIVDLVFRLPIDSDRSIEVVEAVGTVYEDLRVLDEQRRLNRQLANGITTNSVDLTIQDVQEAAALRPSDEIATTQRMLILSGLERIREATIFNERVGQDIQNGVAIVQLGISSHRVEVVMKDILEAKELVEAAQPVQATMQRKEVEQKQAEFLQDIVDVAPTLPSSELITDAQKKQLGRNYKRLGFGADLGFKSFYDIDLTQPLTTQQVNLIRRRGLLMLGVATVGAIGVTYGTISGVSKIIEVFTPPPPTKEERRAKDEADVRDHSLTEQPSVTSINGWEVSHPILEKDEEFKDLFNGTFRQVGSYVNTTPIYAAQGENIPLNVANPDIKFEISTSEFREPLAIVRIRITSSWDSWERQPKYFISGRINPEDPKIIKEHPNVVQIKNVKTKQTFFVTIAPLLDQDQEGKYLPELIYLKKVKRNS